MTADQTTELGLAGPFEVGPAIAMLAAHAVPGAELVDVREARHTRILIMPGGLSTEVTVTLHRDHVTLRHPAVGTEIADLIAGRVRRWLDLDLEPSSVRAALGTDPRIGALVTARPGLRVISYPDGFEAAVMSVLGQQVSVAAGRTFGGRAVAAFGTPGSGSLRVFPTPPALAASTPAELQAAIGVTHARSRTLHALATASAAGLDLDSTNDDGSRRARLLALPGIGPWTVDYLAVRAWGDRDAYPAGDLVLQRALGVRTAAQASFLAQDWSPFRAYALFHLWSAALGI